MRQKNTIVAVLTTAVAAMMFGMGYMLALSVGDIDRSWVPTAYGAFVIICVLSVIFRVAYALSKKYNIEEQS